MQWTTAHADYALQGLDAACDASGELFVTGYDAEGLWLVKPMRGFAREKIADGKKDGTRDGASFFGATALALDRKGGVHVAYDYGEYPKAFIRLSSRAGGAFHHVDLAKHECAIGSTGNRALAIALVDDAPIVAAVLIAKGRTLTLLREGAKPDAVGAIDDGPAMAVDATGALHLAFVDDESSRLRYGKRVKGAWKWEDVGDVRGAPFVSLALDASNAPHLAFLVSRSKDALGYASRTDEGWSVDIVDKEPNGGFNAKLVFDATGRPCIGHWASKSRHSGGSIAIVDTPLRLAVRTPSGWASEPVAPAFRHSAFAMSPRGAPCFVHGTASRKTGRLTLSVGEGEIAPPVKKKKKKT
jgi:hypothetical protein